MKRSISLSELRESLGHEEEYSGGTPSMGATMRRARSVIDVVKIPEAEIKIDFILRILSIPCLNLAYIFLLYSIASICSYAGRQSFLNSKVPCEHL